MNFKNHYTFVLVLALLVTACGGDSPSAEEIEADRAQQSAEEAIGPYVDNLYSQSTVELVTGPHGRYIDVGCSHQRGYDTIVDTVVLYTTDWAESDDPIPIQLGLGVIDDWQVNDPSEGRNNLMIGRLAKPATSSIANYNEVKLTMEYFRLGDNQSDKNRIAVLPTQLNSIGRHILSAGLRINEDVLAEFVSLGLDSPYSREELNCVHNSYAPVYGYVYDLKETVSSDHYFRDVGLDPRRPLPLLELPVDKSLVGQVNGDFGGIFLGLFGAIGGSLDGNIKEEVLANFIVKSTTGESYRNSVDVETQYVLVEVGPNTPPSVLLQFAAPHNDDRFFDPRKPGDIYDIDWLDWSTEHSIPVMLDEYLELVIVFASKEHILATNDLPEDWQQ